MLHESWIASVLDQLRSEGRERRTLTRRESGPGHLLLNMASNDYLGLARSDSVVARSLNYLRCWGAGAQASRLVTGTLPCHQDLEQRLAAYKGYPSALVFGSGYAANIGVIPAIVGRADYIIADRLAHASIMDASMLSRAKLFRFRHNDANHLSEILQRRAGKGRCVIITESVFSMDGDLAPLDDIACLAERYGAMLMVDEAHATGVFGSCGSGLVKASGLNDRVNICMGTLSKALGGYGGFVACSTVMRELLVNRARSFIFSTAMPPSVAGAALGALDEIDLHPGWGRALLARASSFRERLKRAGLDTGRSESQIIPVMVGCNRKSVSLSKRICMHGMLAPAIRPPTVPDGTARLRLSITLAHSEEVLERAADIIIESAKAEGIIS